MRFVYGKQDWTSLARGQENCYLLTNGLGGFSSCTLAGSNTRSDYAFLMACVKAPNSRYNMVHRLEESLEFAGEDGKIIHLSSQEYLDQSKTEEGYRFLDAFSFEDLPRWRYRVDGVEVVKEIGMKQGENLAAVRYRVENRTEREARLIVAPHMQFVPKGHDLERGQMFSIEGRRIHSNGYDLFFSTNGTVEEFSQIFCEGLYYAYDACDGRRASGNTCMNHRVVKRIKAGEEECLELIYSMEKIRVTADEVFRGEVRRRGELVKTAGLNSPLAQALVKGADQFVAYRASTDGKTILAGYPFFEDWGRDTMTALPGCCISTGRVGTARSILKTFAAYCKKGLMPNLFPEGQGEPMYNTADAALLFIQAVYLYEERTGDLEFVKEMWPVMESIISSYKKGTDFHIHMDVDGLICAGAGLEQVTWMDVCTQGILPTPRHGKAVEINAYWYNALRVMEKFSEALGYPFKERGLAAQVKDSFCKKFWNEETGCLKDVLTEEEEEKRAENQIRCNQIWAVSLPFTMLPEEQERKVVDVVYEKLYTPYGLRTLDRDDAEFHGHYGGEVLERDLAYHQGTVWVYPLGAYYLAYLKVHHGTKKALEKVREQVEVLESALREGCVGQLPEIYDGENPTASRGCFAQAWSVGEILRVMEMLERPAPYSEGN